MKRYLAALIGVLAVLFIGGQSVSAQTNTPTPTLTPSPTLSNDERVQLATIGPPYLCGDAYRPCGPIPWAVREMPTLNLPSPTFRATLDAPNPLVPTATPTATSTGVLTATPILTLDGIQTAAGGLQGVVSTLNSQGTQTFYINLTPVAAAGVVQELSQHVGVVFGFARAIRDLNSEKWAM